MFLSLSVFFFFFFSKALASILLFFSEHCCGLVAGLQQVLVIQRTTYKNKNGSGSFATIYCPRSFFSMFSF